MANPCVLPLETCCSAAGASGQTVTARRAALSLNDFNPPYDMGDLYTIANQLSELERYKNALIGVLVLQVMSMLTFSGTQ